jgi:surface protein
MNVTINQIRQEMTTLVQAHDMVNSFFWGDFHRAYNEKEQFYPLVCSYLSDGSMNTNLTQMQLVVIVCDKTFKGFENLNDTESDTVTVARHLFNVVKQSPRWNALLRVNSATLSKFIENTRDEVAGVILTMNVDVKQSRSLCDLPLDNYDFDGQFVGNQCEPVLIVNSNQAFTFSAASGTIVELPDTPVTVFDQDGNELGNGLLPSVTGGNIDVISVPCADANFVVEYADGTPIESGSIPSGGFEMVVVPNCEDATYNLDNSEGSTLFLGSIPSGDNETIIAPDGTANVKNTSGTTVATGLVPSGGSANITAPDGTVQINGDQVATVASGGMVNVAVENESGTPIGTFDDDTGVWVVPNCPDGTVTVNRDGVFFADVPVASGGTATVNVPSAEWIRPIDWLPMPTVTSAQQTFVGLHAVIENGDNYVAFRFTTNTGNYQVDWGDGTVTTHASNTNAEKQYDFATYDTGNATLTSRGYKQAMITVTPVSGNLLTCNFQQRFTAQNQPYSTGFLDCILSMPNASSGSSIVFGGGTVRHSYVERFNVLTIGACTSMAAMFQNCSSLESVPLFNTANVTVMGNMFFDCNSLRTIPLLDTSSVISMGQMFRRCSTLQTIPLLDTSSVTSMSSMFNTCVNLQTIPLLDTSIVTNMDTMFQNCFTINNIPPLDTTLVNSNSAMFIVCNSLNRCQMVFQRTVSFQNCQLSRDAIVEIFNNLATVTTAQTITITGNWGVTALSAADLLIAPSKGWTVTQ